MPTRRATRHSLLKINRSRSAIVAEFSGSEGYTTSNRMELAAVRVGAGGCLCARRDASLRGHKVGERGVII
jgi:hypothetical protein